MADTAGAGTARFPAAPRATTPAASTAVFVGTFAIILAVAAALLAFDLFLARVDRRESDAHAAAEYRAGLALLAHGRAREAADRFGAAVATDRTNRGYALALAQAQLADGRTREAESTLQTLLDRAENDGAANLAMARAALRDGRADDATSYFHRAIFGRWGADSVRRRADARWELIDLLARRGETHALLAELLPLDTPPPDSLALRRRLGELFVRAGSPARGAALLREVIRRDPDDADAYAGMGEAALALGNFRTARADFAAAARLRPTDERLATRLALADTVLAIDPVARGIGAAARYERSRALLARTIGAVERCSPGGTLAERLAAANAALVAVVRPDGRDAAGEAMVEQASDLWAARPGDCAGRGLQDEALGVVLARIGQ